MPDVTIIGGGPGGSTAAMLLARGGWDVTLIEQSRFPRDKVCGECLSALGFDVLTRLGLARELMRLGSIRLGRCQVHASSGRSLLIELPQPMWGLSRHALDGLLLEAARRAGAAVRQPVRCESLTLTTHDPDDPDHSDDSAGQATRAPQRSPGSVAHAARKDGWLRSAPHPGCREIESAHVSRSLLRLRDLITNSVETVAPSHVILADGKATFANDPPAPTGDFGIKAHFIDVNGPRDRIELFGVRGAYGGLAAIEDGRWNAAFSVPAARLKAARGDLDRLFAQLTAENATLARRLAGAQRVGPCLASPLPRFPVRNAWPASVTPIGNAAAALEPIGGEGMGLAMRSAELAALRMMQSPPVGAASASAVGLSSAYRELWRRRRLGCRAAALAVSSRGLSSLLALHLPQPLLRGALWLMGKGGGADSPST